MYCCELCRTKNIWYTKMAKVSYKAVSHPERGIEKHLGRGAFFRARNPQIKRSGGEAGAKKSRKGGKEQMKRTENVKKGKTARKYDLAKLFVTVLMSASTFSMPAYAAATQVTGKINVIYDIVIAIVQAAGAVVLAWGIFEFATAYQSHDSSQQTQSLKRVVAGILMVMAGIIVNALK